MEMVAHGLWAAAAAINARRAAGAKLQVAWVVWWSVFPDVLAFAPSFAAGLWLRLVSHPIPAAADGHMLPHVHIGLPLYPAAHSLVLFLIVFGLTSLLAKRIVFSMLGCLLHIVLDIPTHSLSYYATQFLWPISDYRIDGIAWWTPWFWASTYGALGVVYFALWKKRWLSLGSQSPKANGRSGEGQPSGSVNAAPL